MWVCRCLALQESVDLMQNKVDELTREKKKSVELHQLQVKELETQVIPPHSTLSVPSVGIT